MSKPINLKKTIEVIERMKLAKIGNYQKWEVMIKKINKKQTLSPEELQYYSNLTRIYKDSTISNRTKIYHTKLSQEDEKPPCKECGEDSLYYCNMNDQYFCNIHVVGLDKNEV